MYVQYREVYVQVSGGLAIEHHLRVTGKKNWRLGWKKLAFDTSYSEECHTGLAYVCDAFRAAVKRDRKPERLQ